MRYRKIGYVFYPFLLTLIISAAGMIAPYLDEASAATAVVSVSVANIRSSPTVNSTNIVGTVYQNTPVQISSQNGQWYQV
ncbi:MAG: SH3 domain-containing protein, partial [Syntrophomonadaceae bacterium]